MQSPERRAISLPLSVVFRGRALPVRRVYCRADRHGAISPTRSRGHPSTVGDVVVGPVGAAPPAPCRGPGQRRRLRGSQPLQTITVLDTPSGCRRLIFDRGVRGFGAVQSEIDLANPDVPTLSYVRHVMVALPIVPRPRRILVVGLGGASIQRFVRKLLPEATIETASLIPPSAMWRRSTSTSGRTRARSSTWRRPTSVRASSRRVLMDAEGGRPEGDELDVSPTVPASIPIRLLTPAREH